MPNVKIYVDEDLLPLARGALVSALIPLRALLCDGLTVEVSACQIAILTALVMPDLPRVNVEIQILPHPARTRERLVALARKVQVMIGASAGTHTAVRIATLEPEGYVALK